MRHKVTVYAGPNGERSPSIVVHDTDSDGPVEEILRKIGLEYKTADYFPERQVVIVVDPVNTDAGELREALDKLNGMAEDMQEFIRDAK